MNNYEYIIASLPVLEKDEKDLDTDALIGQIKELCSDKDRRTVEFLLDGYDGSKLSESFYREALKSGSRYIREFFTFDLNVRNSKVKYLNEALDRPEGKDVIEIETDEFSERSKIEGILAGSNLLARERNIDELFWQKIDELTEMEVFSLDRILGLVSKIKIIDRWVKLDRQTGRELFRKLVNEIKETHGI